MAAGSVLGDLAAADIQLGGVAHKDAAAAVLGGVVVDAAAFDVDLGLDDGQDTGAAGSGVLLDRAFLHGEDGVLATDGHAAAVCGCGVGADVAAVQGDDRTHIGNGLAVSGAAAGLGVDAAAGNCGVFKDVAVIDGELAAQNHDAAAQRAGLVGTDSAAVHCQLGIGADEDTAGFGASLIVEDIAFFAGQGHLTSGLQQDTAGCVGSFVFVDAALRHGDLGGTDGCDTGTIGSLVFNDLAAADVDLGYLSSAVQHTLGGEDTAALYTCGVSLDGAALNLKRAACQVDGTAVGGSVVRSEATTFHSDQRISCVDGTAVYLGSIAGENTVDKGELILAVRVNGTAVLGTVILEYTVFQMCLGTLAQADGAAFSGGGVALQGVEIAAVHIVNQAHMGVAGLEEQVAGLGGPLGAGEGVGQAEGAGACQAGALEDAGGHACLTGAPGNEHGAPGSVGQAVPVAVLGVIVVTFGVTHLGQGHADDVCTLVAGVYICIRMIRWRCINNSGHYQ